MRTAETQGLVRVILVGGISMFGLGCGESSDDEQRRRTGVIGVTLSSGVAQGYAVYKEPVEPSCGIETIEGCSFLESCFDGNPVEIPPTDDPGTVTVHGTPLELDSSGQIYLALIEAMIRPGDAIAMSASGSDNIPPHAGSVVMPPVTTLLEPSFDAAVVIDRSRDLELRWTPVAEGSVGVTVTVLFPSVGSANVSCAADAAEGRLTIPAQALARLPPTDAGAGQSGSISVSQGNSVRLKPAGYDVWLSAGEGTAGADAEIL